MGYVLGVDLGTSAVKVLLVNRDGAVVTEAVTEYPLFQEKPGHSEQDPEDWVNGTINAIKAITNNLSDLEKIEGISFSGQMHGLVLLDEKDQPLRRAILWNDTRTTEQCREIEQKVGIDLLHTITKNPALEGFTLPKLMWVKKYEPELFNKAATFVLPKDYVRYRLTGALHMDYSDAAGTLLLNVANKTWSEEMCAKTGVPLTLCPPLVASHEKVGVLREDIAKKCGLSSHVAVFAGGADNACGAIGTGILREGVTLSSTGTSGVILSYEKDGDKEFNGRVHYFNHGEESAFYTMGVTLAAGYSLNWFKDTFAPYKSFEELVKEAEASPPGARGLLFTPYLVGERTPHADADIRGSFIGVHSGHSLGDFTRAVIEGVTFSLNETVELFREHGKTVDKIVCTGGGAKSDLWLQIQADIFNATVVKLKTEQGPGMGAAMLAAYGLGWFSSLKACSDQFIDESGQYEPSTERVAAYRDLFGIYQRVYNQTKDISADLKPYRSL
ncbi:xylulokinase [Salipaludibacillus agaradhaerens]|uniref:xylulokinase n=1 Tax=Salipaludibacillus agaradhaerens TaxID=76935 RepID=UPI0021517C16|nr:xylulokinase [Salipaludibacillus agaradhaerens]MCR6107997.1 xylulokinase [Salipaludibacillus agaradhaerens]MCR6120024.1 xylulokinase [Salipaludibacillus agaradhaerens]